MSGRGDVSKWAPASRALHEVLALAQVLGVGMNTRQAPSPSDKSPPALDDTAQEEAVGHSAAPYPPVPHPSAQLVQFPTPTAPGREYGEAAGQEKHSVAPKVGVNRPTGQGVHGRALLACPVVL